MSQSSAASPTRSEAVFLGLGFLALLILRLLCLSTARFDTDESQHLHVVWGWTAGLLQYRDFFDNHAPLFHLLFAPVLRCFGERADILVYMRAAMIPLWAGAVYCIYLIGCRTFSLRAGLWAALLAAASPRFFFKMGEFRTDVLWTLAWFAALAVLAQEKLSARRFFLGGLLLGIAFAVSLKTSMMLISFAYAGGGIALIACVRRSRVSPGELFRCLAAAVAGFAVVPALVLAYFAFRGGLDSMYHSVILHNQLPGADHLERARGYVPQIAGVAVASLRLAFLCVRKSEEEAAGFRRAFILLVTCGYYILVRFCWPIITGQDYAPLDPLFFVCLTPLLLCAGERLGAALPQAPVRLIPVLLMLGFGSYQMIEAGNPLRDSNRGEIGMVGDVLALTAPGEYVMDNKGETIFRPRAFYYALETLTLKWMALGSLKDDMIQRMIDTRTAVVHGPLRMPEEDVKWERANYVSVGSVDVLGMKFPKSESPAIPFQIAIPAQYAVVADQGAAEGTLDGTPLNGPRELAAGAHEFRPADGAGRRFAIVWARAVEKGYTPFPKAP